MNRRRRAAAGLGVVAVCFGLAGVAAGVTGPFSLTAVFVTLVGLIALVQGARYALARRAIARRWTDLGEPERRYRPPTPGDEFDEETDVGRLSEAALQRTRRRLREAAVDSLVAQGEPPEAARRRVDAGEWTTDPVAEQFLRPGPTPLPLREQVRALVAGRTQTQVRVGRTAAAVAALWEGESP